MKVPEDVRYYVEAREDSAVVHLRGIRYPLTAAEVVPKLQHFLDTLRERLLLELGAGFEKVSLGEVIHLLEILREMTEPGEGNYLLLPQGRQESSLVE